MKIGVCSGIERAHIIKALGFDHIEENLFRIASLTDDEFEKTVCEYKKLDLPVYYFNCFFGGDISLYGDNSLDAVRNYASGAIERAHRLGGKVCVIGSGKARALPDGVSREFAVRRFTEIVSVCADIADRYGMKIAIEPLNSKETNFINTVSEASGIVKATQRENVGSLIDFFHSFMEGEGDGGVLNNADTLIHTHIARPNADRLSPRAEDEMTVAHWAELLSGIGYDGAISLECGYRDFENDLKEAAKYMRYFKKEIAYDRE